MRPNDINTWKKFSRKIRGNSCDLLISLSKYPGSILVGGCQRSGTTMISNIIMQSDDVVTLHGLDKELTAALVLSGFLSPNYSGRFCFQTTYLNENYDEYFKYFNGNKLIWMIRNPYSVVYSLTRFSERFCLDELFVGYGQYFMTKEDRLRFDRLGLWSIDRVRRACYSYNSKIDQIFSIVSNIGIDNVCVIDYDDLIINKVVVLPKIFDFIGVKYEDDFLGLIKDSSLGKADLLSKNNRNLIGLLSESYYRKARELC